MYDLTADIDLGETLSKLIDRCRGKSESLVSEVARVHAPGSLQDIVEKIEIYNSLVLSPTFRTRRRD